MIRSVCGACKGELCVSSVVGKGELCVSSGVGKGEL